MTSMEKAINLGYLFLSYKPKKTINTFSSLFCMYWHVSIFSEKSFWPQYMYLTLSPNNGFHWCPLGKLSHLGLEQLIDGTTNGGGNLCVLTPFRQWNGSWRSVSLSLRRSVGAGVVVPAEKFHSPPPCILSAPWSTRCLKHASLVSVPFCIAIFSFSDKHSWCAGLFLILMVLLRYC